jgi:hypothetical protein
MLLRCLSCKVVFRSNRLLAVQTLYSKFGDQINLEEE